MKRPDLAYYLTTINTVVTDTEQIGTDLNGAFEEIKGAIENKDAANFDDARRLEIIALFQEGTDKYRMMFEKIGRLKAPARLLGNHKKFEQAYKAYVVGCEEMVLSLQDGIDEAAFRAAEEKQDQATDQIAAAIQKMTQVMVK